MTPLLLAAALAQPLVGEATSFGDSPVHTTVEAVDNGLLVQVFWPAFDRHTLEVVVAVDADCDSPALASGRTRAPGATRCVDTWVDDPHPVYEMRSRTHVRCVLDEAAGACKLGYTPWFTVQPPPARRSAPDAPGPR